MGMPLNAAEFLVRYGPLIADGLLAGWVWTEEDSDFGKSKIWNVRDNAPEDGVGEVVATVDLQASQLTLGVSEGGESNSSTVAFLALVQFEDERIVVDGVEREYSEDALQEVIVEFNELVA